MIFFGLGVENILPETLPEGMDLLEIPAALLPAGGFAGKLESLRKKIVLDPADAALCRVIPEEPLRVRMSFLSRLEMRLRELSAAHADCAVLSMDLDRMASDAVFGGKAFAMLRNLQAAVADLPLALAVRARFPNGDSKDAAERLLLLLQAVPGLRAVLELHPHEPAFAQMEPAHLKAFLLLHPVTEVVYDRSLGNRMTLPMLEKLSGLLKTDNADAEVIFRPGNLDVESFFAETAELAELLKSRKQFQERKA